MNNTKNDNLSAANSDDYSLMNRFNDDENHLHYPYLNNSQYKEFQTQLSKNLFVFDDADISKTFTQNIVDQLTSGPDEDFFGGNTQGWLSAWHPGIGYDWPVHEWAYPFRVPMEYTDENGKWSQWEWLDCPMKPYVMSLWDTISNEIYNRFNVTLTPQEAHFNATAYGQDGKIHEDTDGNTGEIDSFILMFLNDDMNAYDSGEFVTYKSLEQDLTKNKDFHKSEITNIINPKRARIVFADSRILHRGLPPSRLFPKTRFTIVYKTMTNLSDTEKSKLLGWNVFQEGEIDE